MGIMEPEHTAAWRVSKKMEGEGGKKTKERVLILCLPTMEARKEFVAHESQLFE